MLGNATFCVRIGFGLLPGWGCVVGLVLKVAEFSGPLRWRWLLVEEGTGRPLADHEVRLDADGDDYRAFTDLYRYLRWHGSAS
jgi:hypothetical protein